MSKYDGYWLSIIDSIVGLVEEAFVYGRSRSIDVSGLRRFGRRGSWYGSIVVSRRGVLRGNMAHVVALGRILVREGVFERYGDTVFRVKVSSDLKLSVECLEHAGDRRRVREYIERGRGYSRSRGMGSKSKWMDIGVGEEVFLRIHELLEPLPLYKYPFRIGDLPGNAIYFFYEDGEVVKIGDKMIKRIVRVGTHRSQHRFPNRIYDHFYGNKNSSVFRRHLGAALLAKENPGDPRLREWVKQGGKTFRDVEERVTRLLKEKFSFKYIRVDDRDERLELEEKLISTLAKFSAKYASPHWLGHYSPSREVRESGLWNVEHVYSPRQIGPKELARLEQLVYETLRVETKDRRALILIPCCKSKNVKAASNSLSPPLPGIADLRSKLLKLVEETPYLREKPENKRGILNPYAPLTRAVDLYVGRFYTKTKKILLDILDGKYPYIHVLIVSAFYGLVKLNEGIKEYELTMNDKLVNDMKVYKFWQENGLWKILLNYILRHKITHIWSLLPSSQGYPYHQVFEELWEILRNNGIKCIHVKVPEAGSATGTKRAEWLIHIIENNPLYLIHQPPPLQELEQIPDHTFQYTTC